MSAVLGTVEPDGVPMLPNELLDDLGVSIGERPNLERGTEGDDRDVGTPELADEMPVRAGCAREAEETEVKFGRDVGIRADALVLVELGLLGLRPGSFGRGSDSLDFLYSPAVFFFEKSRSPIFFNGSRRFPDS